MRGREQGDGRGREEEEGRERKEGGKREEGGPPVTTPGIVIVLSIYGT
jgi:hypothetical protein